MNDSTASTRPIEQRKNHRYFLRAPVFFCSAAANGPFQSGEGITRDIDTNGVYIHASELPTVGALVQMDIMLPKLSGGPGGHLTGEGVVLRVETPSARDKSGAQSGFAVSVQFYLQASESLMAHLRRPERVM